MAPDAIHHHVKSCRDNIKNLHFVAPEYGGKFILVNFLEFRELVLKNMCLYTFFPLSLHFVVKVALKLLNSSQVSHVFGRRDELFKKDDDDDNSRV